MHLTRKTIIQMAILTLVALISGAPSSVPRPTA